jgi:Mn-dependent DtxR family transcriptional regulator
MREDFAERRRRRSELLEALYRATDGDVAEFVAVGDLAEPLGIEPGELRRIVGYLEERHWIVVDDHKAGIVRITADGVDRVEAPPEGT